MIRRLLSYALKLVFVFLTTFVAVASWTYAWPQRGASDLSPADAIVCLGGDMRPDDTLGPAARLRTETCVALWREGIAPLIVFTGAGTQTLSEAELMAAYAITKGLPADVFHLEGAAQSTLQNAIFSLPMIPDARELIIVTEAFHLPRAAASFRWAAWILDRRISVQLVMSEPMRRSVEGGINWQMLTRESVALWFNLARAVNFSLAVEPDVDRLR